MATNTADDLYVLVRQLPTAERLRLVERIAHDLCAAAPSVAIAPPAFDWADLAGAAPGLLDGRDAQEWVSSSRSEADNARDKRIG